MQDGLESRLLESVEQILTKYRLCNSCLGRQFALLGRDLSNYKRGEALKIYSTLIASELHELKHEERAVQLLKLIAIQGLFQPARETLHKWGIPIETSGFCYICEGFMDKLEYFRDLILQQVQDWEFSTFLMGSQIPENIIDREDTLRAELNLKYGESIKGDINREIGKLLQTEELQVDFDAPDIVIILNPVTQTVDVQVNPLLILGRYRKLERGISQTRWICWKCEGKGCDECKGKGLRFEYSVEGFIADPILKAAAGTGYKFHGAGREDIDARMLGTGRPFIVEIKEPRKRKLDLNALETEINTLATEKVEVSDLSWSNRGTVRNIKAFSQINEKTYRLLVEPQTPVDNEKLKEADEVLSGATIQQRTPRRVMHRRADKLRIKTVYDFTSIPKEDNKLEIIVRCQGGCYVKELVTGDEGRTRPSLSELINTEITVIELDVLNVQS
ncbi:MAG: tRNA pseudouridine(54/55) synthase Pus10 [Promethearchaeota archaeon]|nr:MAG: tRNA pseudouridine(54/55) synthase Pus10 [Candidatus Lokiarchaeota archaeon]